MGNYNIILAITIIVSIYAIYLTISLFRIIYHSKQKKKDRCELNFNITENIYSKKIEKKEISEEKEKSENNSTHIKFELNGF